MDLFVQDRKKFFLQDKAQRVGFLSSKQHFTETREKENFEQERRNGTQDFVLVLLAL
jgi:hypothetical protein